MTSEATNILESFDRLPDWERKEVGSEILRRSTVASDAKDRSGSRVRIVRRGRLSVAAATEELPPLTERDVLAIRDALRESRTGFKSLSRVER